MDNFQAMELNLNQNQISYMDKSIAKCSRLKVSFSVLESGAWRTDEFDIFFDFMKGKIHNQSYSSQVLRLEENCLDIGSFPSCVLADSNISTLTLDGNLFTMKQFADLPGYDDVSR